MPQNLELISTVGFGGNVPRGLIAHPDGEHIIYPIGSTVVVKNQRTGEQNFLRHPTGFPVNSTAISPSGRLVASGYKSHMGFKADIIVWDLATLERVHTLSVHKMCVQALSFSCNERYLGSLGGPDDNNTLLVWDLESGVAICGARAGTGTTGDALDVAFMHHSDLVLVTAGSYTLRKWIVDPIAHTLQPDDCNFGSLKRVIRAIAVSPDDAYVYGATSSGDVVKITLSTNVLSATSSAKTRVEMGAQSVALTDDGEYVVVGGGGGAVAVLESASLRSVGGKGVSVEGGVSTVALGAHRSTGQAWVGTRKGNMYAIKLLSSAGPSHRFSASPAKSNMAVLAAPVLLLTAHFNAIRDVAFPSRASHVFATCSSPDIRIWDTQKSEEVLRVSVPNLTCHCIEFTWDGRLLVSGWDDGKIRAFAPQSGRLVYVIHDAHQRGVTALSVTQGGRRLVSGGGDGQVRVWDVAGKTQSLVAAMKEHKSTVTAVHVRSDDLECISSSSDGSCIVWDLTKYTRSQVMFAPSMFKGCAYSSDENQVVTVGTDRKIAYWDTYDGTLLRELESDTNGALNGVCVARGVLVCGGEDKRVSVYAYDEGVLAWTGVDHSSDITACTVSPDHRTLVSVAADGAVYVWAHQQ